MGYVNNGIPFDPADFGFDARYNAKGKSGGRKPKDADYLIVSIGKDGNPEKMKLILRESTANLIDEIIGERLDFALDDKGRILVYKGSSRAMSRRDSKRSKCEISMGTMVADYCKLFGVFRRAYMQADVFAGGRAILFTPTGERDKMSSGMVV